MKELLMMCTFWIFIVWAVCVCVNEDNRDEISETEENVSSEEALSEEALSEDALSEDTLSEDALSEYLDAQIASRDFDNLLVVAKCQKATSEHINKVAEECAKVIKYDGWLYKAEIGQNILADAIINSSALTDTALKKLLNSPYESVWIKVIHSDKCSTSTLSEVAKKCADMIWYKDSFIYAEDGQKEIATEIIKSPAYDVDVAHELMQSVYPSIWLKVIASDKLSKETLMFAAKKCIKIISYEGLCYNTEKGQQEVAKIILQNPAVTANVIKELSKSQYPSVTAAGLKKLEEIEQIEQK